MEKWIILQIAVTTNTYLLIDEQSHFRIYWLGYLFHLIIVSYSLHTLHCMPVHCIPLHPTMYPCSPLPNLYTHAIYPPSIHPHWPPPPAFHLSSTIALLPPYHKHCSLYTYCVSMHPLHLPCMHASHFCNSQFLKIKDTGWFWVFSVNIFVI